MKKAAEELGYSWKGFTVRNTNDGSETNINSKIYKTPINKKGKITLCAFSNNSRKGKLTIVENKLPFIKSLQG
jgi:hypothetical protein